MLVGKRIDGAVQAYPVLYTDGKFANERSFEIVALQCTYDQFIFWPGQLEVGKKVQGRGRVSYWP